MVELDLPHPQKIKIDAIKAIIIRALYEQGVREALPEGQRRHEFKGAHGFRKFFKTHAEQFMNHSNVELLLGHSADALQASYYKPTEKDVLSDYLKAVDVLSIDYDKNTLTKQVAELAERNEEQNYIIKGKLAEKEKEAEETRKKLAELEARQEIMQANSASQLEALMAAEAGVKPRVEIITYKSEDGLEGLLKAAELAREKNQKRKEAYLQRQRGLEEQLRRKGAIK